MERSNKEEFYKETQKFFDAGLFREIYSDEVKCICNACNVTYICFPYIKSDVSKSQIGVMVPAKGVEKMISEKYFVHQLLYNMNQESLNKWCCFANDKLFNKLIERKKKTDIEGPTQSIDLELEERILNTGKVK